MRRRASHPDLVDLSRIARALGGEVRRHLDTSHGFPTHHRITTAFARRVRRQLRDPDPRARLLALAALRVRILGRPPSPPTWVQSTQPQNCEGVKL